MVTEQGNWRGDSGDSTATPRITQAWCPRAPTPPTKLISPLGKSPGAQIVNSRMRNESQLLSVGKVLGEHPAQLLSNLKMGKMGPGEMGRLVQGHTAQPRWRYHIHESMPEEYVTRRPPLSKVRLALRICSHTTECQCYIQNGVLSPNTTSSRRHSRVITLLC